MDKFKEFLMSEIKVAEEAEKHAMQECYQMFKSTGDVDLNLRYKVYEASLRAIHFQMALYAYIRLSSGESDSEIGL